MQTFSDGGNTAFLLTSIAEICRVYRVGRRTVRSWIDEGAPIAKLDGSTGHRVLLHELQAWLVERTRKAREEAKQA